MTAGDVHGAVECAGVELVGLADIEHGGAIGDQRRRTRGVDFADLRLGGGEEISERGHALNPTCLVGIPTPLPNLGVVVPTPPWRHRSPESGNDDAQFAETADRSVHGRPGCRFQSQTSRTAPMVIAP